MYSGLSTSFLCAKRCGRGLVLGSRGAEQEHRAFARLRAHLQAPDLLGARLRQPRHQRTARAGLQVMSDLRAPHRSTFANVSTGSAERDERLVKALVAQRVIVGVRGPGIRVAPHLHNSIEDIDRFLTLAGGLA